MSTRFPDKAKMPKRSLLLHKYGLDKYHPERVTSGTWVVMATVGAIGLAAYVMIIMPMRNQEYYKKKQGFRQSQDMQDREKLAGALRPWSNPFEKRSDSNLDGKQ